MTCSDDFRAAQLLPRGRRPNWYDAGRLWSGDQLDLADGAELGGEIAVRVPLDGHADAAVGKV